MNNDVVQQVDEYTKKHLWKKRWKNIVTCLAAIVVFCTTYALILPAITMDDTTTHIHSDECYETRLICGFDTESDEASPPIHVHSDECYESVLICGKIEGTVNEQIVNNTPSLLSTDVPRGDLAPFLTSNTTFNSAQYNEATNQNEISFHMDFNITRQDILDANYLYNYNLPAGIIIPDSLLNKSYIGYASDGSEGFDYQYTINNDNGNYSILIDFRSDYVADHEQFKGYLNFSAIAGAEAWKDNTGYEFKFNDTVTVIIPPEQISHPDNQTLHYDMNVNKGASAYDYDNNKITYTVTVYSAKGTPNPIDFTDTLTADGLTINNVTLSKVEKAPADNWGGTPWNATTDDVTDDVSGSFSYNGGIITMSLPALEQETIDEVIYGQKYTITYDVFLEEPPIGEIKTVDNTVKVTGTDDAKGETVFDESETTTSIDKSLTFTKSGTYDNATGKIKWKIKINQYNNNIAGYVLTDSMLANATDLTVSIGSEENSQTEAEGNYTVLRNDDNKIVSITFNAVGDTGENTGYYFINYTTEAKPGWDTQNITNSAALALPGEDPLTSNTTVHIFSEGSVAKQVKNATAPDANENIEITWRTEITVPSGGLPSGTVIEDTMKDGQWMTWTQIQQWASVIFAGQSSSNYTEGTNYLWPQSETPNIIFYTDDQQTFSYADIAASTDLQDKKFVQYKITLPNDIPADPYGGQTIYFEYNSYADVSAVTDTSYYYNQVTVTPPDSTSKNGNATYTYKKSGVWKTDGNGHSGTSNITTSDGNLTWKVKIRTNTECSTVTVIDTLPENVTLSQIKINYAAELIPDNDIISGTLYTDYRINGNVSGQDITLNITKYDDGQTIPAGTEFELIYSCKISQEKLDSMGNTTESFTNTVTVNEDDGLLGSDTQTQDVTYKTETSTTKVVDKTGGWDNDSRMLKYSIELNPDGNDLLPDIDTLTLIDKMIHYVGSQDTLFEATLLPSSVQLYRAVKNSDGTLSKRNKITDFTWRTEISEANSICNHTIIAEIPDETPMIFEYAYGLWTPEDSTFDDSNGTYWGLSNTAELQGVQGNSSDESRFDVKWEQSQTSGGIITDKEYILYKVDQDNYGKRLPGAEFTLNSSTENNLYTYVTDQSGSFIISMPDEDEINAGAFPFEYNKLYYIVETKSPAGYELPSDPPKHYFYFSKSGEGYTPLDPSQIPDGAADLSTTAHVIFCKNIEIPTASISVEKKWYDSSGNDVTSTYGTSISFDLYQIASTTPPSNTGNSGSDSNNINFTYQVRNYGSTELINESVVIPRNSLVTVKATATSEYGLDEQPMELKINGSTVSMERTGTLEFSYTFTATGDTTVIGDWALWQFSNGATASYTYEPPSDPDPNTPGDFKEPEIPDNGTKIGTYSITKGSNWSWAKDDLPLVGVDEGGNTVYYTYYVIEQSSSNYTTSYNNNIGISSGTIVINNTLKETPTYELPLTGGLGTYLFTFGGLLLIIGAVLLLIYKQKRRWEEFQPS